MGLWFVLFSVIVGIAATNTGNNALYMVLTTMLGILVVSGITSRFNLRGILIELDPPGEIYVNRPFPLFFAVRNQNRWWSHFMLILNLDNGVSPRLIPLLPKRGVCRGQLDVILTRRGRKTIPSLYVGSLFPLDFFQKTMRHDVDLEVLVFPELFDASNYRPQATGRDGQIESAKKGRGAGLHSLRPFERGDDPRRIHWKQTAKTGDLILIEKEAEEGHRVAVIFDNAVGQLVGENEMKRFEILVSEAATAAVEHLKEGWEVALLTRDEWRTFGSGPRQRMAILEILAETQPIPRSSEPLEVKEGVGLGIPAVRIVLGQESGRL